MWMRKQAEGEQTAVRELRTGAWREWFANSWGSAQGLVAKWCKGEAEQNIVMLQRPDKTFTSDINEIDGMLHGAWMLIFRKYADQTEPSWEEFVNRFGDYIPEC